jgi:hypothetical protein
METGREFASGNYLRPDNRPVAMGTRLVGMPGSDKLLFAAPSDSGLSNGPPEFGLRRLGMGGCNYRRSSDQELWILPGARRIGVVVEFPVGIRDIVPVLEPTFALYLSARANVLSISPISNC